MSDDRELLEKAARAAGMELGTQSTEGLLARGYWVSPEGTLRRWDPLSSDEQAFRLAVKLCMEVRVNDYGAAVRLFRDSPQVWHRCEAPLHDGIEAATRRAIVRAAAALDQGRDGRVG